MWWAIGALVFLAVLLILLYNQLVTLRQRIKNAWAQIEVQLKRRYDLIPNLVSTVKGYAAHEKETFERVTQARRGGFSTFGRVGVDEAAHETEFVDTALQLGHGPYGRALGAVLGQASHATEAVGEHIDHSMDEVIAVAGPQLGDLGRVDGVHLQIGAGRQELYVGAQRIHLADQVFGQFAQRALGHFWGTGGVGAPANQLGHIAEAFGGHHDVGVGVNDHGSNPCRLVVVELGLKCEINIQPKLCGMQ